MSWRKLFPLALLFSCVDGFFVNLFYPAIFALLAKDIFFLIVYILFIFQEPPNKWFGQFKRSLGSGNWHLAILLMFLGLLQIFNPEIPASEVGIMGFKVMFFYWPLTILSYVYIDSFERLRGLLRKVVYLSIPICLFGLIQFWEDPDFMVRVFGGGFRRALIITYGTSATLGYLRVLGTFASSGQFSAFLFLNILFTFGLLFTVRNKAEKMMMISCLVLNYVTMLATGSRGWSLLLFPATFLFVLLCRWLWRTFFIILILGLSFNFGFSYLGKAVVSRFETVKDVEMIKTRTFGITNWEFRTYFEEHPFGRGIGTASTPSRYVAPERTQELGYTENYLGKLQYEVGIVGVVLFYLFLLSLTLRWIKRWLSFSGLESYPIIAALSAYYFVMAVFTFIGVIDNPPVGIFFWAIIGMVVKVSSLHFNDQHTLST